MRLKKYLHELFAPALFNARMQSTITRKVIVRWLTNADKHPRHDILGYDLLGRNERKRGRGIISNNFGLS